MKIIFVTGGVVSSLGKGIISSSLGRLLADKKINVGMMKCDPYLNVDSGTMSPIEHGEVFVTKDGGETDLDIGHYERFLNKDLTKESSLTSGRIYQEILDREREGFYDGKTVQIVPHVTSLIKEKIFNLANKYEVLIVEIGGSVGDIESLAYTESIRQIKYELSNDALIIHVGLIPYIKVIKELKTKPIQRSVNLLRSLGVSPEILITRSEISLNEREIEKISMFTNVDKKNIFQCIDASSIYKIPLQLANQNFENIIAQKINLKIEQNGNSHIKLIKFNENLKNLKEEINIAIVGKYVENIDSYISIIEALKHSTINNKIKLNYELIDSKIEFDENKMKKFDGILVPGGFGENGLDGKMKSIEYGRKNNVPFLGICFGMQLAILEFAKNVLKLDVDHGEINPNAKNKIIDIMDEMIEKKIGGTMRLGNYECELLEKSLTQKIYDTNMIKERHRHRYEFNNYYKKNLEDNNMIISGKHVKTGLAEIIEYVKNDFFVAVQFHPELSSKITNPNKLIDAFVNASLKYKIDNHSNKI